jgi:hypothetical protein
MYNTILTIFGFFFIYSLTALLRLGFNFFRAIFSNPPKKFEMTKWEILYYEVLVSYLITYLIY